MISLVTKSAAQARSKSAKKVTAQHLKQVIQQDESFDFLSEIVSKVPDAPASKKEVKVEDSDEGEPKKRRGRSKRKTDDDEW
jgi:Dr1-associated corepressor